MAASGNWSASRYLRPASREVCCDPASVALLPRQRCKIRCPIGMERPSYTMRVLRSITAAAVVFSTLLSAAAPTFPLELTQYLDKYVKLDAASRAQLAAGRPVTRLLDADPSKEVVVFGAVWIDAPIAKYLAAVRDIERFESGGSFLVTKKIGAPPAREDFARLTLPAD